MQRITGSEVLSTLGNLGRRGEAWLLDEPESQRVEVYDAEGRGVGAVVIERRHVLVELRGLNRVDASVRVGGADSTGGRGSAAARARAVVTAWAWLVRAELDRGACPRPATSRTATTSAKRGTGR